MNNKEMEKKKREKGKKRQPLVPKPVTLAPGFQASPPSCIDGRTDVMAGNKKGSENFLELGS